VSRSFKDCQNSFRCTTEMFTPGKVAGRDSIWQISQAPGITEQRLICICWVITQTERTCDLQYLNCPKSLYTVWIAANLSFFPIPSNVSMLDLPTSGAGNKQERWLNSEYHIYKMKFSHYESWIDKYILFSRRSVG